MQAIQTRFICPTDTKPARIKAWCERGSLTVSANGLPAVSQHEAAARLLCEKFAAEDVKWYGTPIADNPWLRPMVSGTLPGGDGCHVFVGR